MRLALGNKLEGGPHPFDLHRQPGPSGDLIPSLPDDITVFLAALNAPPAPFVPEQHRLSPGYGVLVGGFGPEAEHAEVVAALRAGAPPLFEFATPIPFVGLQQMFDESAPWGTRGYEKAIYLDELTDPVIDVIARHFPQKASPMSFMPTFALGGAYARHPEDDSAFGGSRSTRHVLNVTAVAPDPDLLAQDREWARAFWAELSAETGEVGSYVNFMSDFDQDRIRASYGPSKYERLRRIKATYDPDNVFRLNANIEPAGR